MYRNRPSFPLVIANKETLPFNCLFISKWLFVPKLVSASCSFICNPKNVPFNAFFNCIPEQSNMALLPACSHNCSNWKYASSGAPVGHDPDKQTRLQFFKADLNCTKNNSQS